MPGRAAFFPNTEIPLKNIFVLSKSEVGAEIYQSAIENKIDRFSAEGVITTESTWSLIEKEFKTGF
jgi:Glu-tRNA(Gln) amidotransferase subunit E-like FAD-binding protein